MTGLAGTLIGQSEKGDAGVHEWWSTELARERRDLALREAEDRRLEKLAPRRTFWTRLRARTARKLFGFAVVLEREETWHAVWERLEAPRQP